jgi:hypothetical protein
MHAIKTFIYTIIFSLFVIPISSQAKTMQIDDWFYSDADSIKGERCIIYSYSARTKGDMNTEEREDPYLYVIKKGEKQYTIGMYHGFEIGEDAFVVMKIKNRSYDFHNANPDYAWTYSSAQDISLIDKLLQASDYVTIHSEDVESKVALDYYSLKGFIRSMRALDSCKLTD